MKPGWIGVIPLIFFTAQAFCADALILKTDREKISYAMGLDMGNQFKRESIEVDPDLMIKGFKDAISGGKPLLSLEETATILAAFQKELMEKEMEKSRILAEKNKKEGELFLVENKKQDGVVTLKSGLQYRVLKDGTGPIPKRTDMVTVHYRGSLTDGFEFENSFAQGRPELFSVNGVIEGWTEALLLMRTGSKWQLYIPPELAYGDKGADPIGPNSVLIYDVELVSIEP